ncbi:hypothetical protein BGZ60DRAFT_522618 [Tricladium varicosporioides]|nr:hypothetical protein BGZ60DRAFT_522618 [Hymenoscyphus varicosporioides]
MLQGTTGNSTQIARINGGICVALKASLPFPAVIYLNREIPLQLAVITKNNEASIITVPLIKLEELSVTIRTETKITVGPNASMITSTKELVHLKNMNLSLEATDNVRRINSNIFREAMISNSCPSFTTCTVLQQHVLVVGAGVVLGSDTAIHVLKTEVNIEIHSGTRPATLSAFDNNPRMGDDEEEIFIPWRIGSERHLGISRQTFGTTSEPPPPY